MAETTKYYTMKECFDACGDEDFPYVEGLYNDYPHVSKKMIIETDLSPCVEAMLSDKWQIKRAGPVVLSADDIIRNEYSRRGADYNEFDGEWDNVCVKTALSMCTKGGIKNGHLEEWQRKEQVELREAAIDVSMLYHYFKDHLGPDVCGILNKLNKALNNLKPPYEQDNQ
jgi:hypothetical protein